MVVYVERPSSFSRLIFVELPPGSISDPWKPSRFLFTLPNLFSVAYHLCYASDFVTRENYQLYSCGVLQSFWRRWLRRNNTLSCKKVERCRQYLQNRLEKRKCQIPSANFPRFVNTGVCASHLISSEDQSFYSQNKNMSSSCTLTQPARLIKCNCNQLQHTF